MNLNQTIMKKLFFLTLMLVGLFSCKNEPKKEEVPTTSSDSTEVEITRNATKDVYFGNLHVHTSYSFDGYTNGSVTTPDDAYRWAKGGAIAASGEGGELQIKVPLDWYAVSDHAEYLGVFKKMEDPNSPMSELPMAKEIAKGDPVKSFEIFNEVLDGISKGEADPQLADPALMRSMWKEIVTIADKHNEPGKFTTFPAFEWTSNPNSENLHRVVLFENSRILPDLAYSALDSNKEEDLWKWMENTRANGSTLLAVPHNGNASNGLMFPVETSYDGSKTQTKEYAEMRMRNEPLYEIAQLKGASETHPQLSPNDEFAGFEIWDYTLSTAGTVNEKKVGSYIRDAYKRGIKQESEGNGNPYKYGLIGDSDTHNWHLPYGCRIRRYHKLSHTFFHL